MDTAKITKNGPEGGRVVLLNDQEEIADVASLLARAPDLEPEQLAALALQLSPAGYTLITDPAAYAAQVQAQLDREDPAQPWQEGVPRISDFGLPDFDTIVAPARDGNTVTAHVRDSYTGLPYLMTLVLGGDAKGASFKPLPLTPFPDTEPTAPGPDAEDVVGPQAFPDLTEEDPDNPFDETEENDT
jgi:hypothetical protein